jgi:aryl-alcohol dehydrogenase
VILTAVGGLANCGFCGLVAGSGELVLPAGALAVGKKLSYLIEGDAVPQVLIPHMIQLWRQGRFSFDRLIKTYPLDQISQAEADSHSGSTVKPVLVPDREQVRA